MKRIRWATSRRSLIPRDGVWVDIDDDVHEFALELWARVKAAEPGPPRSELVSSLRTVLDLAAEFPGMTEVPEPPPDLRPSYLRTRQREAPPASVPFNEFPEGF